MSEQEKAPKVTPADQGVPAEYLNEEGKAFRIGMDARLKSDLVNSALGLITTEEPGNSLHVFTEAEAIAILEKRDWVGFLDRKRQIVEEKAAKAAASAAKREEQTRERAAEKEKKAAEKQAEKEAKAAEKAAAAAKAEPGEAAAAKSTGQAVPDPKSGSKKQTSRSSGGSKK